MSNFILKKFVMCEKDLTEENQVKVLMIKLNAFLAVLGSTVTVGYKSADDRKIQTVIQDNRSP